MNKKLMILGAGLLQLSAIKKAVALGFHVITVDNMPKNIGHQYSHDCVECSTTARVDVLKAARKLQVDGICTFSSDVAIPTLGYVCDQLGLVGPSLLIAETLAQKHKFRKFLKDSGQDYPRYIVGATWSSLDSELDGMRYPVIVKPVDTSGSRGVSKINTRDKAVLGQAFNTAVKFSYSGLVCIEEFIEGVEVGGDGILLNGSFYFIAITHKHLKGFVVAGHSLPTNISDADQERVRAALQACCTAVGYNNGPLNFDVIINPDRVVIIEMSPRNGGNGLPGVIERFTGIDLEKLTLQMAIGDFPKGIVNKAKGRGCGSLIFGNSFAGKLESISDPDELKKTVPEVYDVAYAVNVGEQVKPFEHNGNMVGFTLFDCEGPGEFDRVAASVIDALQMNVLPSQNQTTNPYNIV